MLAQLATGAIVSLGITSLAYLRRSLSLSGGIGAMVIGTLIFGLGGWAWGVILGIFFVTSSFLSHFKESEKQAVAEKFDKGHRRDFGQVLANGGVGALAAILSVTWHSVGWLPLFVGIMATVTADTWATELGTLSRHSPRLITTGRIVPTGTSGGISLLGTLVSLAGGLVIGLCAGLMFSEFSLLKGMLLGGAGGLVGSLFDSLLGATVQQIYLCTICQKETEKLFHCGAQTSPLRGWSWLNNDLVNLIASVVGGLVVLGLWQIWPW